MFLAEGREPGEPRNKAMKQDITRQQQRAASLVAALLLFGTAIVALKAGPISDPVPAPSHDLDLLALYPSRE